jgi:hypothetical protein
VRRIAVAGLIDLHRLSVFERDRRVREIGVGQDRVDVAGRSSQRTGVGQQLLLGVGERMGGAPEDVAQIERVGLQPRFGGGRFLHGRLADFQEFGLDERRFGAELREELLHLLLHALRTRQARVLIGEHAGVHIQPRQLLIEVRHVFERVGERLG